jgi:hypothetical protein
MHAHTHTLSHSHIRSPNMQHTDIQKFDINDLPNSSFNLVLGKRRSGKSYMVESLIKRLVSAGKIHQVFLFSGTDAGFDFIGRENRFRDPQVLNNIVANYTRINDYNKIAPKRDQISARSCVIIDDLAPALKSREYNILETIAVNGRHIAYEPCCLHFFVLCQSLTKIPRVVRLNADCIWLNSIASSAERDMVMDENMYQLASDAAGKRAAKQLYHDVVASEPFVFLCIESHRQNVTEYSDYLKKYKAL